MKRLRGDRKIPSNNILLAVFDRERNRSGKRIVQKRLKAACERTLDGSVWAGCPPEKEVMGLTFRVQPQRLPANWPVWTKRLPTLRWTSQGLIIGVSWRPYRDAIEAEIVALGGRIIHCATQCRLPQGVAPIPFTGDAW